MQRPTGQSGVTGTVEDRAMRATARFVRGNLRAKAGRWTLHPLQPAAGGRLVAAVRFEGTLASSPPLVAKCYADDQGSTVFGAMHALQAAIEALAEPVIAVPTPYAYMAAERCLLQQQVPSTPCAEFLGGDRAATALEQIGRALGQLHGLPLETGRPRAFADHLDELLRPHPARLAERLPQHRNRIEAILAACREQLDRAAPRVPLHRDFHYRQLTWTGERVWVMDWDLFARGDPALDVGNFLMYLQLKLGRRVRDLEEWFLAGYRRERGAEALGRARYYRALMFLRRACKGYRLAPSNWAEELERMLRLAESVLEQATPRE